MIAFAITCTVFWLLGVTHELNQETPRAVTVVLCAGLAFWGGVLILLYFGGQL